MNTRPDLLTDEFRALSARLGSDPLQVQGPGGNTSVKADGVMWIKASGTELADAVEKGIFVAVDRNAALAEARGEAGDGSCRGAVIDPAVALRPSIETTFHAALDDAVVAHTHSVATIVHAISPQGREVAREKLNGLPFAIVPYAKPGLALTRNILAGVSPETKVVVLENHGLICAGASVAEVSGLIAEVEARLALPARESEACVPEEAPPAGFGWAGESWIARDAGASHIAAAGSYYPDHVVFLGPALPRRDHAGRPPAILCDGQGVALRHGATGGQKAMLRCLSDVLSRLPEDWDAEPIGQAAEAELLDWDAEKYRQALAERG